MNSGKEIPKKRAAKEVKKGTKVNTKTMKNDKKR